MSDPWRDSFHEIRYPIATRPDSGDYFPEHREIFTENSDREGINDEPPFIRGAKESVIELLQRSVQLFGLAEVRKLVDEALDGAGNK